jgi:hypothetical protein
VTFEDQVELALRAEALQVEPPIDDLVAGGVERGLAQRRRFRARLAAGTAALVLVAGAGTVLAAPFLDGDDDGNAPVASGDAAAPAQADPAAEIDPAAVVEALVGLLPPGEITEVEADVSDSSRARFQFAYDDGGGASWIMGSVGVTAGGETPSCPVIVNGGSCEVQTLEDGTVLMLTAGPFYPQPGREPDRLHWSAVAASPSGLSVALGAMNTPTEKDSEPTREEPPLSLDQLAAVVTDGVWADLTEGVTPTVLAEEDGGPGDGASEPPVISDAARAFAAVLGPDWLPDDEFAQPGPNLTAGLPAGYTAGWATFDTLGPDLSLEEHCAPGEEKGAVKDACVTALAPGGETVHVQWGGTVPDGPYAQESLEDRVTVLIDGEGGLTRVSLWVADPAEISTPERRAAARTWLEEQVDDLSRAVVAAAAGDLG